MGSKIFFGNKSYWYLKSSEELVLNTIVNVLRHARYQTMGTTKLVATVKAVIESSVDKYGDKRRIQKSTISRLICVLGMIRTYKKVGSRRCLKTWEIRRKRYWKLLLKKE